MTAIVQSNSVFIWINAFVLRSVCVSHAIASLLLLFSAKQTVSVCVRMITAAYARTHGLRVLHWRLVDCATAYARTHGLRNRHVTLQ